MDVSTQPSVVIAAHRHHVDNRSSHITIDLQAGRQRDLSLRQMDSHIDRQTESLNRSTDMQTYNKLACTCTCKQFDRQSPSQ